MSINGIRRPAAASRIYKQLYPFISQCISEFQMKTGANDRESLLSACNEAFVQALMTYDPKRGKLVTWVTVSCWWAMRNQENKRIRWQNKTQLVPEAVLHAVVAPPKVDHKRIIRKVSPDAKRLACYALSSVKTDCRGQTRGLQQIKKRFRKLGWSLDRLEEAVRELRTALGEITRED